MVRPARGLRRSGAVHNCYPPTVNYTPLYYLINGRAFDTTNVAPPVSRSIPSHRSPVGNVLVRLVNAGLRMHVPSIVGRDEPGAARVLRV